MSRRRGGTGFPVRGINIASVYSAKTIIIIAVYSIMLIIYIILMHIGTSELMQFTVSFVNRVILPLANSSGGRGDVKNLFRRFIRFNPCFIMHHYHNIIIKNSNRVRYSTRV